MSAAELPAYVAEWMNQRVVWHRASGRPRHGIVTDVWRANVDGHRHRYARVLWDETGRLDVIEVDLLSHEGAGRG